MPKSVRRQQTRKLRERDISRHTDTRWGRHIYTPHTLCAEWGEITKEKREEKETNDKLRVCANARDRDSERARDEEREREFFSLVRQSCHRLQYTIVLVCEQARNDEQYTHTLHTVRRNKLKYETINSTGQDNMTYFFRFFLASYTRCKHLCAVLFMYVLRQYNLVKLHTN